MLVCAWVLGHVACGALVLGLWWLDWRETGGGR
jgi:hypothetical protein